MPLTLAGEKVRLRPLDQRDLTVIRAAYQDFDLQLTTDGDAPPLTDDQILAFWTEIISNPGLNLRYFAIEPLESAFGTGQCVGACSLQQIDMRNRHAELSIFMVAPEHRNQGYGSEAIQLLLVYGFEVVRLDKVYLGAYDFNEGGLRAYERVGFRYEGHLRQMLYYEGRYWDEWAMRILRPEWERYVTAPAEGLRPYHPADQDAAIDLLQRMQLAQDAAGARGLLRRWWRQIDREVYGYQAEGKLVGLLTLPVNAEDPTIHLLVADTAYRKAIEKAVISGQKPSAIP
jgi:RimJ/RimL family protein N-acetyltransferase